MADGGAGRRAKGHRLQAHGARSSFFSLVPRRRSSPVTSRYSTLPPAKPSKAYSRAHHTTPPLRSRIDKHSDDSCTTSVSTHLLCYWRFHTTFAGPPRLVGDYQPSERKPPDRDTSTFLLLRTSIDSIPYSNVDLDQTCDPYICELISPSPPHSRRLAYQRSALRLCTNARRNERTSHLP
jgi:hypothetical protein